jgi:hypothetical protein
MSMSRFGAPVAVVAMGVRARMGVRVSMSKPAFAVTVMTTVLILALVVTMSAMSV